MDWKEMLIYKLYFVKSTYAIALTLKMYISVL